MELEGNDIIFVKLHNASYNASVWNELINRPTFTMYILVDFS